MKTESQAYNAAKGPACADGGPDLQCSPAIGPKHMKYLQFPPTGEDSRLLRSLATDSGDILKFQHPD